MCGISGFNWRDEDLIEKMVASLTHRGPDAHSKYLQDGISLGHNRLSIIDLDDRANQPMLSRDKNLAIVFNGEIYNFKELKEELLGYSFKTESDTEVILAGYEKWGSKVVEKLNGIFAFALWDNKNQTLFCARDRAGVKPFYYYWDGDRFIFASEVQAIFNHDIPRRLNKTAFNQYMRVLYVAEPLTMTEGVFKLPPSSTLTLNESNLSVEKYEQKSSELASLSYEQATKTLRNKVIEAVRRQLASDVPVGIYLSGGIDSSVVLFAMSQFRKNIKTFSVGFDLKDENESEKFNKDFNLAAKVAKFFGTKHYTLRISARDARSVFEKVAAGSGEPVSHPTAIAMALLARYAKKEATVILTGDGGDELFGGYDRYLTSRRADILGSIPGLRYLLPSKIRRVVEMSSFERLVQFEFEKDWRLEKVLSKDFFRSISEVSNDFKRYIPSTKDKTEALMQADFHSWLPDYAFALGDSMSSSCAVEQRVPLVDNEIINFSNTLPRHYKVGFFSKKKIFKKAFRKDLPEFLFDEPKRGWFSPGAKWLRDPEFMPFVMEVLSPNYYEGTATLFDWAGVSKMLENHVQKKEYNLTILWAILTLQMWARFYRIRI